MVYTVIVRCHECTGDGQKEQKKDPDTKVFGGNAVSKTALVYVKTYAAIWLLP